MGQQIATFLTGDTLLGLDIRVVKEIHRHIEPTPIPGAPEHMSGLMNLRGRVVTVIDLNISLNRGSVGASSSQKLLILKTNGEIQHYQLKGHLEDVELGDDIVGLVIDKMEDVLDIEEDDILNTPANLDTVDKELIEGVVKLKNRLVLILDINALLKRISDLSLNIDSSKKHREFSSH